jgi:hypothetical protein
LLETLVFAVTASLTCDAAAAEFFPVNIWAPLLAVFSTKVRPEVTAATMQLSMVESHFQKS